MTAFFPPEIPVPLIAGYSITSESRSTRTQMAGGNVKSRRQRGPGQSAHDVSWALTATERAALYAFAAQIRTAPFWVPLAMPGSALRSVVARFIAPPSSPIALSAIATNVTSVRARLLVDDAPIVTDLGTLIAEDGSPLVDPDGFPIYWEVLA